MDSPLEPLPEPIPSTIPAKPALRTNGWDLFVYLAGGLGLFVIATSVVSLLLFNQPPLALTVGILTCNLLFLGGSVWWFGVFRKRVSLQEIGFWPLNWQWKWLGLAILINMFLLPLRSIIAMIVLFLTNSIDSLQGRTDMLLPEGSNTVGGFLLILLFAGILVPISEELFFRGLLHRWFSQRLTLWPAILLSSLIFAIGHFDSFAVAVSAFIAGMVHAYAYEKSKTLWLPILLHITANSIGVILSFAVTYLQQALGIPLG